MMTDAQQKHTNINQGEEERAIAALEQRIVHACAVGDYRGECDMLGTLARMYHSWQRSNLQEIADDDVEYLCVFQSNVRQALACYERQRVIVRELGDRQGEGTILNNLGRAYLDLSETFFSRDLERVQKAIGCYEEALAIARELGDRRGEVRALKNLGGAFQALSNASSPPHLNHRDHAQQAIDYLEQARAMMHELGDRQDEVDCLCYLGYLASINLSDYQRAIGFYTQALTIVQEVGDHHQESTVLSRLGFAHQNRGDGQRALAYHQQALAVGQALGDDHMIAQGNWNLGRYYEWQGDLTRAVSFMEVAIERFQQLENDDRHTIHLEAVQRRLRWQGSNPHR